MGELRKYVVSHLFLRQNMSDRAPIEMSEPKGVENCTVICDALKTLSFTIGSTCRVPASFQMLPPRKDHSYVEHERI